MRKPLIGMCAGAGLLAAFFLILPVPRAPQPEHWPTIEGNSFALIGVRVFDGNAVHKSADVLVEDGIITAASPKLPIPDDVPRLAADGYTLLPAFIDAHTHNFGTSRREALNFGVGTQIDMFTAQTTLAAARTEREAIERVERADMWSAGTLVTAPGGHGTEYGLPIPTLDGPEEADKFVAARIAEGSDFIKLIVEPGWSGDIPTLDAATLTAAIAAAHRRHKLAVVHVGTADAAATAIRAGADGLAHVFRDPMPEALGKAIVDAGTFVVPTLSVLESIAGRPNGLTDDPRIAPYLDAVQKEGLLRQFPAGADDRAAVLTNALDSTRKLHSMGVPILAGTDAPNPGTAHGASLHRELELLVEAGLTTAEALHAATAATAAILGIEDRGRIASGMRADLVLVTGDPLADITATRDIAAIWKNGYRIERTRFDGKAKARAKSKAPATLGSFDDGTDGWTATTDAIMGGQSEATIAANGGVLTIETTVRAGAPFPWAGAMRGIVPGTMEPADAGAYSTLVLRVRGNGIAHVILFSGVSARSPPIPMPLTLNGAWQEHTIDMTAIPGLDRARLRAVGLTAGPNPGSARLEIDSVVLR